MVCLVSVFWVAWGLPAKLCLHGGGRMSAAYSMMSKHVPSALGELHHVCNKTARIALFLPLDTTTSGKHSVKWPEQSRA